jgi:GTP cyclohydrolase IA
VDKQAAARAIEAFLKALGRDPAQDAELAETGNRVANAFADDLLDGYRVDVEALVAGNTIHGRTELVVARDLSVATVCPHHLMVASGLATVAFAPDEKLIGVGTLAAVVDAFAHRLTLQERVGEQVVAAIARGIAPRWVACKLVLSHACMTARGERKHGARIETFAYAGDPAERGLALSTMRSTP